MKNGKFIVFLICIISMSLFVFGCEEVSEAQIEQVEEDIEEALEEIANDDDVVLDEVAAANAPSTQAGTCVIPQYPGSSIETINQIQQLVQAAHLSTDSVAQIQAFYDAQMNDPWMVFKDWERGSKQWQTGEFDAREQTGCSAIITVQENEQGSTTIGSVLMKFV